MHSQFGFCGTSLFKLQTDYMKVKNWLGMDHAAELVLLQDAVWLLSRR